MFDNSQIQKVQDAIGYTFKDPSLLTTAFTHPSAASKSKTSNALLIFIGKPVCELLVRDYLYSNYLSCGADPHAAEARIAPLIKQCPLPVVLNLFMHIRLFMMIYLQWIMRISDAVS